MRAEPEQQAQGLIYINVIALAGGGGVRKSSRS
jgi:hypothetical protein